MSDSRNPQNNLGNWADQLLERITAAAREAIEEGGPAPSGPASPDSSLSSNPARAPHDSPIYEAIAEGLAHLRQPALDGYSTEDVRQALDRIFPNKSGPPSAEWLRWLHHRVSELSGGLTVVRDDEHPAASGGVLFRVYYGKLEGTLLNRRFVLSPAGVEYTS